VALNFNPVVGVGEIPFALSSKERILAAEGCLNQPAHDMGHPFHVNHRVPVPAGSCPGRDIGLGRLWNLKRLWNLVVICGLAFALGFG
jgi:hypothetical protein